MDRILEIERASFGADAWPRELFREYYCDCPDLFLVSKVSGRIAAYIIAQTQGDAAEIASLAVHPDYRKRGVARLLLEEILRRLRAAKIRKVELAVRTDNLAGARLYRSFGFRQVRTIRRYYDDGGDAHVMARAIQ